ncbi:high affinity cationic amino acid transporter 1-like isoform X2 [Pomacea canaliculata]|nr:high affinity cationic amino acid transporter 1-like isoform X2 [Pomacea canaliculata]XP_025084377.1 high affinity cationic amino acid transporter 1-like isoform X2 [Pomacea canaliculata]
MSGCVGFMKKLVRKKVFTDDNIEDTSLHRCLTTWDLIGLGIGSTLGTGIYIVAGQVAKQTAGPAVVLSFFVAGVASAFAGMCYAEFAARVPRAGSAYVYSYVTVGELMAFIIGWNLLLEYIIGTASVARAWSAYFDSLIDNQIQDFFKKHMPIHLTGFSSYPDLFSFAITLLLTALLAIGVKESTRFNNIFTCINLFVIAYVIICGLFKAKIQNWNLSHDEVPPQAGSGGFLPFGFSGMMSGAATCFYAYVGFDCIATTGEETKNPQKSIPIGIVVALLVISFAYCGISAIVTLMCPYYLVDANAPLPFIFEREGWGVARYIIAVGALCGLSTSLLGAMFPLPRVLYAMGTDGVIFRFMAKVSPRFKTPIIGTAISGVFAGFMATIFDLDELVDMMSIGTLLAYTLVAVCVLILRYEMDEKLPMMNNVISTAKTGQMADKDSGAIKISLLLQPSSDLPTRASSFIAKCCVASMCFFITVFSTFTVLCSTQLEQHQAWAVTVASVLGLMCVLPVLIMYRQPQGQTALPFKVPFVPIIPAASCLINIYLMLKLSSMTWVRFGIWMLIGFSIYFTYGVWQSGMNIYDQHVVLYHAERKSMNKKTYTSYTEQHHHIEVSSNDDD